MFFSTVCFNVSKKQLCDFVSIWRPFSSTVIFDGIESKTNEILPTPFNEVFILWVIAVVGVTALGKISVPSKAFINADLPELKVPITQIGISNLVDSLNALICSFIFLLFSPW